MKTFYVHYILSEEDHVRVCTYYAANEDEARDQCHMDRTCRIVAVVKGSV
jgi:hypothetical protein